MYVADTRLPDHKLKKLLTGKGITISPGDISNTSNKAYKLMFGKMKDINRYVKNIKMGKGFILIKAHLDDMQDTTGGSIFTKALEGMKKIGDKMGKPFEKSVQVNPFTAGYDLGHDVIAPAIKKGLKMKGGKVASVKKINRQIADFVKKNDGTIKKALRGAKKAGKQFAADHKDELAALGRSVVDSGGKSLGKATTALSHIAAKDTLEKAGVYNEANPYQHGQFAPPVEASGGALGLGGTRLVMNQSVNPDMKARMAHVRSFRKKGGSFRPLGGGSILPLG